jgi:hypothetical protein
LLKKYIASIILGEIDNCFWLNYCRKSYILPKHQRCIYVLGLAGFWQNTLAKYTSGYIVGTYIISD